MKYSIRNVVNQSVAVSFCWEGCRTLNIEGITNPIEIDCVICCFRKTKKGGYKNCQYDYSRPIVFYKFEGLNLVAWIQFINGKWEELI